MWYTVVEAWSVSSVSVKDLNIDRRETRNASVFISEELLRQQGNGKHVYQSVTLYSAATLHDIKSSMELLQQELSICI